VSIYWVRSGGVLAAVLAAGSGCSFDSGASAGSGDGSVIDPDGGGDDGGGDDAGVDCESWDPVTPFEPCDVNPRGGDLELTEDGTYLYDTGSDQLTFEGGPDIMHQSQLIAGGSIRLLTVRHLEIGELAKLRVTGSLPLLLAVWDRADLIGTIDVASSALAGSGAGANPSECDVDGAGPGGGAIDVTGGGGGGGGAFGGDGGAGGFGGGSLPGSGGRAGGATVGDPGLRGGCPGARGGAIIGGTQATRGSGGGALAISARFSIDLQGVLHAGGGEGLGAVTDESGGGGGAGSGGLIWLDAPDITLGDPAVLAANGGGGGEGADNNDSGDPGDPGKAGRTSAAGGSSGGNDGGNGGAGSDADTPDGTMGANGGTDSGGGGGGGGAGVIRFDGDLTDDGATISPAATAF